MKGQVGLELILLTSVIMLLSLLTLGAFVYLRYDIEPSIQSSSVYEFYNRMVDYKKIAMTSCNNFNALFEHNFGTDITIEYNLIKGEYGVIYMKDVVFTNNATGSMFKFKVSCNNGMLEVSIVR